MGKSGRTTRKPPEPRNRGALAADDAGWIKSEGYRLTVQMSKYHFTVELYVPHPLDQPQGGKRYQLIVTKPDNTTDPIVQSVLGVIAASWPKFVFEFKSDKDGNITAARKIADEA
jgi:hypothetical protein